MATDSSIPSTDTVSTSTAPPVSDGRYRCAACGNLTRFDVVTNRRTKAFHHYSVGGNLVIEEEEVLAESVEEVSCRWCGHGNAIETVEAGTPTE
jgi:hypothetical protein